MDIFGLLTMAGGLALFLYGMNTMGDALAELSGGKLETLLEKLTSTRIRALLLGVLVTAVIQSSSATTVMVVGFVNSGIMQLSRAAGIIMGANIGTTLTSWLLSLAGVSGSSVWVNLLKPSSFSPVLAFIGIFLLMTSKNNEKQKDVGNILMGFAILMFGMETMSGAVKPLAQNERFTGILTMFSNPILGMLAGTFLTAAIQSSSASIGILQALCLSGAVEYSSAVPIIMGQNIGTCVTALISSAGASKNAKRASMIHLYFNIIGTVIFMTVFYGINAIAPFAFLHESADAAGIALLHSLFNIGCTILLFPFADVLVKLAVFTVRDKKGDKTEEAAGEEAEQNKLPAQLAALDERFLETPGYAMNVSRDAAYAMAQQAKACIFLAMDLCGHYTEKKAEEVIRQEQLIDMYEDVLGTYLVKLSSKNLSRDDSRSLSILLHCISDFERISDHAENIYESMKEMKKGKIKFSAKAFEELQVLLKAVHDIVEMAVEVFSTGDIKKAEDVEPLEEVIDSLNVTLRQHHFKRLRKGKCKIELGVILEDLITDLERVSDHCSNIAVCLIAVSSDEFDMHEYVDVNIKEAPEFAQKVSRLKKIYALPGKKGKK